MDLARRSLTWIDDPGIGFFPVENPQYDLPYFQKYIGYSQTEQGAALNRARVEFVARHFILGSLVMVDVGIGCGQFVASVPGCRGYDVNPAGIDWLAKRDRWLDPNQQCVDVATFWDSLEHIENLARMLANVDKFVFVSIPIFRDLAHVQASKHFRTDEHYWYFTDAGFIYFMHEHGFQLLERNNTETKLGREDIGSYAFKRAVK